VYLDGNSIGPAPIHKKAVSPGDHQVKVTRDGYDSYQTRVSVEPGRHVSLDAILSPAAPAAGRLYVNTDPSDAKVRILNITPAYFRGMDLSPGSYNLEASKDGYETSQQWVSVEAGQDRYVSVKLEKTSAASASAGDRIQNALGMEFVYIPPGTFMMGSPSSEPGRGSDETRHQVTLTRGYYLQTTEVTQGQWKAVMGDNPSRFDNCGDDCPVENVSWNDVQEFIRKLNQREGMNKYRLPTEAEWEYACRSGSDTKYCFGDSKSDLEQYAWFGSSFFGKTHPVAQKRPNAWGLYDMHGNVWEWCGDRYGDYPSSLVTDPAGPSSGSCRVRRGGSWDYVAAYCRSADRDGRPPDLRRYYLGFRLARSL
jgi:formylglycine-generating enzyme required for sulfatase activity